MADATPPVFQTAQHRQYDCEGEGEDSAAMGHSSIVCSLLRLCQVDEDVEQEQEQERDQLQKNRGNIVKSQLPYSREEIEAANDRIRSEYESYPATLANLLMDCPCFQSLLTLKQTALTNQRRRRGKLERERDRADEKVNDSYESRRLIIHIVGASHEAELWGEYHCHQNDEVYDAYAEALSELAQHYSLLREIILVLVGPNCPTSNRHIERHIVLDDEGTKVVTSYASTRHDNNGKKTSKGSHRVGCKLVFLTHKCEYNSVYLAQGPCPARAPNVSDTNGMNDIMRIVVDQGGKINLPPPPPDAVVFFNPGFTCPDYTWDNALDCIPRGIPFLVTTNTEMEGIADCQYLLERGFIKELPAMMSDVVLDDDELKSEGQRPEQDEPSFASSRKMMFFGENPNAGSRVRQSGTMANDLFVKNRWIFGGIFGLSRDGGTGSKGLRFDKERGLKRPTVEQTSVDLSESSAKQMKKSTGNTKAQNPALI